LRGTVVASVSMQGNCVKNVGIALIYAIQTALNTSSQIDTVLKVLEPLEKTLAVVLLEK